MDPNQAALTANQAALTANQAALTANQAAQAALTANQAALTANQAALMANQAALTAALTANQAALTANQAALTANRAALTAALTANQAALTANQAAFTMNQPALPVNQPALPVIQPALPVIQPALPVNQAALTVSDFVLEEMPPPVAALTVPDFVLAGVAPQAADFVMEDMARPGKRLRPEMGQTSSNKEENILCFNLNNLKVNLDGNLCLCLNKEEVEFLQGKELITDYLGKVYLMQILKSGNDVVIGGDGFEAFMNDNIPLDETDVFVFASKSSGGFYIQRIPIKEMDLPVEVIRERGGGCVKLKLPSGGFTSISILQDQSLLLLEKHVLLEGESRLLVCVGTNKKAYSLTLTRAYNHVFVLGRDLAKVVADLDIPGNSYIFIQKYSTPEGQHYIIGFDREGSPSFSEVERAINAMEEVEAGVDGVGQGTAGVGQGTAGVGQGAAGVGQGAAGVGQGASESVDQNLA